MKLPDVNPDDLAREVLKAILDHLQGYAMPLMADGDPRGIVLPSLETALRSTLACEAKAVAVYAQRGTWILPGETEDDPDLAHKFAWDALTQVVCAYYGSPGGDVPVPLDAKIEPDTAWGVVLLASAGRQALAQGDPISVVQLAVLSGVSRQRVQQLVQAGELERARPSGVKADSARRWLAGRGVPGF